MELSKFMNGDKKAIVERSEYNYTIVYYLNEKVIKKDKSSKRCRVCMPSMRWSCRR